VLCYTEYKCRNWVSLNGEQCLWHPLSDSHVCFPALPGYRCDMCEQDPDDEGTGHMEASQKCEG
jgi:hypothetical protein